MSAFDEIDTCRRQHKKPAVDETTVAGRLLGETGHPVARLLQRAVFSRRLDRGDGRELAVARMKFNRSPDIDIAKTVAIGETKGFIVLHETGDALQAAAGHRLV